jgi:MFS family permease
LIVPMIAPAIGGAMLLFGSWVYVFVSMLALAGILVLWFAWRMPETLHPEYRRPFSLGAVAQAVALFRRLISSMSLSDATVQRSSSSLGSQSLNMPQ